MSMITQSELCQYAALKERIEQEEQVLAGLRQGLLARLEALAQVESGPLTAEIRRITQRPLTAEKLVPLLGTAKVEELKALVEPMVQRHLIVRARPAAAGLVGNAGPA